MQHSCPHFRYKAWRMQEQLQDHKTYVQSCAGRLHRLFTTEANVPDILLSRIATVACRQYVAERRKKGCDDTLWIAGWTAEVRKARSLGVNILVTCLGHKHAHCTHRLPRALQPHVTVYRDIFFFKNCSVKALAHYAASRPSSIRSEFVQNAPVLISEQLCTFSQDIHDLVSHTMHYTAHLCTPHLYCFKLHSQSWCLPLHACVCCLWLSKTVLRLGLLTAM